MPVPPAPAGWAAEFHPAGEELCDDPCQHWGNKEPCPDGGRLNGFAREPRMVLIGGSVLVAVLLPVGTWIS